MGGSIGVERGKLGGEGGQIKGGRRMRKRRMRVEREWEGKEEIFCVCVEGEEKP